MESASKPSIRSIGEPGELFMQSGDLASDSTGVLIVEQDPGLRREFRSLVESEPDMESRWFRQGLLSRATEESARSGTQLGSDQSVKQFTLPVLPRFGSIRPSDQVAPLWGNKLLTAQ